MTPLGVTQQPPYILLATLLISVTVDMNSKSPPQGFFHFRIKNSSLQSAFLKTHHLKHSAETWHDNELR
ncbi:hypothetical protein CWB98_17595 [Pseudoalteromonas rubra]|uniref:Uncharacterized protein n=1 Tax=Pseudoalteromonas rubra TaxID=43658 RepID=A0A5S3WW67_9GAMM|nr:hypothetical protein CWB98_17595 [Pseudoalteromonas rubra]